MPIILTLKLEQLVWVEQSHNGKWNLSFSPVAAKEDICKYWYYLEVETREVRPPGPLML